MNRDDMNRMPDSLIVFCRVSRNFAAVKKMSADALVVFATGSQLVKMFIDAELWNLSWKWNYYFSLHFSVGAVMWSFSSNGCQ